MDAIEFLKKAGRKGGQKRAENLSKDERSASARKAAEARWAKTEKLVEQITEGTQRLAARTQRAKAKKDGK